MTVVLEEQNQQSSGQALLNAVIVRLGGLLVLMLTVGRWADVIHILVCFIGEAACLLPANDLLNTISKVIRNTQVMISVYLFINHCHMY